MDKDLLLWTWNPSAKSSYLNEAVEILPKLSSSKIYLILFGIIHRFKSLCILLHLSLVLSVILLQIK